MAGEVVLGRADNEYSVGYGTARPATLSLNSLCANTISDITWSTWGGPEASAVRTGGVTRKRWARDPHRHRPRHLRGAHRLPATVDRRQAHLEGVLNREERPLPQIREQLSQDRPCPRDPAAYGL